MNSVPANNVSTRIIWQILLSPAHFTVDDEANLKEINCSDSLLGYTPAWWMCSIVTKDKTEYFENSMGLSYRTENPIKNQQNKSVVGPESSKYWGGKSDRCTKKGMEFPFVGSEPLWGASYTLAQRCACQWVWKEHQSFVGNQG